LEGFDASLQALVLNPRALLAVQLEMCVTQFCLRASTLSLLAAATLAATTG
jgi:hypothetical protein